MTADLGEVASELNRRGRVLFGKQDWRSHKETVLGFWNCIAQYFDAVEVQNFRIYQDGLVADGEMGQKIVTEGVKSGSKNYEIVLKLINHGARLVKTENFSLVKKEYDYLIKITRSRLLLKKIVNTLIYKLHKNNLLKQRDNFITQTINRTLKHDETGDLFLGAHHEIVDKLQKDIQVIELKKREKIREYHKCFLSKKDKEKLNRMAEYLVSPIE